MVNARRAFCSLALPLLVGACAHEDATSSGGSARAPLPCPADVSPLAVDPLLVPPGPALRVVAHSSATGTQDYVCAPSAADGGSDLAWSFVGPEATLSDCNGAPFARHFASEAGASAPKWEAGDGSFVVGKKIAAVPSTTPGAPAVPWLLLEVTSSGGAGLLGGVSYVQRTKTAGGVMPAGGCDAAHAGAKAKVPYSADYWFLGK